MAALLISFRDENPAAPSFFARSKVLEYLGCRDTPEGRGASVPRLDDFSRRCPLDAANCVEGWNARWALTLSSSYAVSEEITV
jgi:hypothetical protein